MCYRSVGWTISKKPVVVITWSTFTTNPVTGSWENCCATASPSAAWRPCTRRMYAIQARIKAFGSIPNSWRPSSALWCCTSRLRSNPKSSPKRYLKVTCDKCQIWTIIITELLGFNLTVKSLSLLLLFFNS